MEFPDNGYCPNGVKLTRCLILGSTRAGKTTLAAPLARFLCPDREKIIVVGPVAKLSSTLGVRGHPVSTTDRGEQEEFFRKVLEDAKRRPLEDRGRLMVTDEADLYFSSAGRTYGSKALQEIVNIGQNQDYWISCIFIARGSSDIALNCRAAANIILIGNTTEPNLLEYQQKWLPGINVNLQDWPRYKFIAYDPNSVPHVLGVVWVEDGEIVCKDWTPPTEEEEDTDDPEPENPEELPESPSPPSGDEREPLPGGGTASTPAAPGPSGMPSGRTTAGSTTPST
jgi:hypothetical protein